MNIFVVLLCISKYICEDFIINDADFQYQKYSASKGTSLPWSGLLDFILGYCEWEFPPSFSDCCWCIKKTHWVVQVDALSCFVAEFIVFKSFQVKFGDRLCITSCHLQTNRNYFFSCSHPSNFFFIALSTIQKRVGLVNSPVPLLISMGLLQVVLHLEWRWLWVSHIQFLKLERWLKG